MVFNLHSWAGFLEATEQPTDNTASGKTYNKQSKDLIKSISISLNCGNSKLQLPIQIQKEFCQLLDNSLA